MIYILMNEKRDCLTRIYCVAFFVNEDYNAYYAYEFPEKLVFYVAETRFYGVQR